MDFKESGIALSEAFARLIICPRINSAWTLILPAMTKDIYPHQFLDDPVHEQTI
jgi:hypothetical protein